MAFFAATALVALGLAVNTLRVAAQEPVLIPKEGDGYQITKTDTPGQRAPSGFEGRTDESTQTAVGNTPATMGKRVVAKFALSNQIKMCPAADGAAEGEGLFSLTVDTQVNGTSSMHVDMRAKAKYKGQVNDDAWLDGPVKAEIDYSYTVSSTLRGAGGALLTAPGGNLTQHITIPFAVSPRPTEPPSVGAFTGGDPTRGQLSDAISVGTALAYWAGVYYSVAQTKWRTGMCAEISYSPPSNTVQPALGTRVTVKAAVKTKRGESVPAKFDEVHAFQGGSVSPSAGRSTEATPLTFTYMAPERKPSNARLAGFQANGTSRAGIAQQEWHTNLGTDWTGQISCTRENKAGGSNEQQNWSDYSVTRLTIDVNDGVGTVNGYAEENHTATTLRPVARQGYVFDTSSSMVGMAEGTGRVTVETNSHDSRGTNSIALNYRAFPPGMQHSTMCNRNGCREQDMPLYIQSCLQGSFESTRDAPNQMHGAINEVNTQRNSTQSYIVNWDLARQGTTTK